MHSPGALCIPVKDHHTIYPCQLHLHEALLPTSSLLFFLPAQNLLIPLPPLLLPCPLHALQLKVAGHPHHMPVMVPSSWSYSVPPLHFLFFCICPQSLVDARVLFITVFYFASLMSMSVILNGLAPCFPCIVIVSCSLVCLLSFTSPIFCIHLLLLVHAHPQSQNSLHAKLDFLLIIVSQLTCLLLFIV